MQSDEKATTKDTVPLNHGTLSDGDIQYPKGIKLVLLIVAICLAVFLVALDSTIIAIAIPRITDHFDSVQDIGWYGSAYFLTSTSLQPLFGRIYRTFDVKLMFIVAISLFELGSVICGAAQSSTALIIGRAIAGIGEGGIFSGGLVITAYSLPLSRRSIVFGLVSAMFGLASVAGPLLGGVSTDHISWRWCFYINLPIGAISMFVIAFVLKIPRKSESSHKSFRNRILELDLIGTSILIPAIICLLLAFQWGGSTYTWNNSRIIGLFVGFGCLIILFIFTQLKLGDHATLPPRILWQRTVGAASCFAFLFGVGFILLVFYLPLYFQTIKGASAMKSGIDILPFLLAEVTSSAIISVMIMSVGYYTPFILGGTVLFAVGSGLITTFEVHMPFGKQFGYQVLTGMGVAVGVQIPTLAVQTVLPLEDVHIGTSCVLFFLTLGSALSVSVGQTVFQNGFIREAHRLVPEIDPHFILSSGATLLRDLLEKLGFIDKLPLVLEAYMVGLKDAFKVTLSCACMAFLAALCLEWKSVKVEVAQRQSPVLETGGTDCQVIV